MNYLFICLVHWVAPVLSFTAEEAWLESPSNPSKESIHSQEFPDIPNIWSDEDTLKYGGFIQEIRKVITGALEVERLAKTIKSSLEAKIMVYTDDSEIYKKLENIDLAELTIVSEAKLVFAQAPSSATVNSDLGIGVIVQKSIGQKCDRCWKVLEDVKNINNKYGLVNLCPRCSSICS